MCGADVTEISVVLKFCECVSLRWWTSCERWSREFEKIKRESCLELEEFAVQRGVAGASSTHHVPVNRRVGMLRERKRLRFERELMAVLLFRGAFSGIPTTAEDCGLRSRKYALAVGHGVSRVAGAYKPDCARTDGTHSAELSRHGAR